MKNAMKKLTSLLLVAVLLVGALPFAASAANTATSADVITVEFWIDGANNGNADIPAAGAMSYDALMVQIAGVDWASKYEWAGYYNSTAQDGATTTANPGDYVYLKVNTKEVPAPSESAPSEPAPSEPAPSEPAPEAPVVHKEIYWEIKYAEGGTVVKNGTFIPKGETANVKDILYYHAFDRSNDWQEKYSCTKAWSSLYQKDVGYEGFVAEGDIVSIVLSPKTADSGNTGSNDNNTGIVPSIKDQNDIFLNIFVNKDFNNCKTIKLNDHWVLSDNKITTYEILNYVVTDYYKAYNTNLGLQCDGLYYSVGSFMYNWLLDNAAVKTDAIDGIDVKRANGTVTINVMVTNAVVKSGTTANADTSNPKTGDSIYTAMTVMGLSAASLAAVMYVYTKKRQAV